MLKTDPKLLYKLCFSMIQLAIEDIHSVNEETVANAVTYIFDTQSVVVTKEQTQENPLAFMDCCYFLNRNTQLSDHPARTLDDASFFDPIRIRKAVMKTLLHKYPIVQQDEEVVTICVNEMPIQLPLFEEYDNGYIN